MSTELEADLKGIGRYGGAEAVGPGKVKEKSSYEKGGNSGGTTFKGWNEEKEPVAESKEEPLDV